ncbi:SAV_2336 N-terminal domain-related protein [Streptomyces sp. NPDC002054]|uniref:SAV_2336 N-terminal domain-related protein n=1 Tax=Streptomyces sp. NPDC002054 TaxID=3154663 RepID=UPI00332886C2
MDEEPGQSLHRLPADDDGPSVVDLADALWIARFLGRPEPEAGAGAEAGAETEAAGPTGPEPEAGQPARNLPGGPGLPGPRPETPLYAVSAAAPGESPGAAPQRPRGGGAAPVRVGRESALTDPLAISRALRPLKQRVPGPGTPLLDEEATARASGESQMFLPAWMMPTERRFAVDLVVDTGPSMAMWQQLATDLTTLFEGHGAFRVTDTWSLDTGAPRPRLAPFHRTPRGKPQRAFPPRHLADPSGRRLLLLLTDGVGPLWRGPALMDAVDRWSRTRPVAVLQVLPHSMWHRTALVPEPVLARSGAPGRATALFRPQTPYRRAARGQTRHQHWVPVLELRPDWLAPWARLVAGQAGDWTPMMALRAGAEPLPPLLPGPGPDQDFDPAKLVECFRGEASAGAFELAGYLAAVPLVLPVMRLVQRAMMPRPSTAHLAEFFLSGLLVQVPDQPGSDSDPDLTLYEFRPGVREALLDTLTRRESLRVLDVVSRVSGRVARRLGGTLDFRALIPAPGLSEGWRLPPESRPFARVAAQVLAGVGGAHRTMSEALAEAADGPAVGRLPASPPDGRGDPVELISRLMAEATVGIQSAQEGVNGIVGSGFFVSPNRVLTSAHVALAGSADATGTGLRRVRIGYGDQLLSGVVEWAGPDRGSGTGSGSEPDLALIRLLDPVDHPCVWVTERPPGSVVLGGPTVCFGWSMVDGEARLHSFRCTSDWEFNEPDGERLLRLTNGPELLPGVSGGPVVDLTHGEVIGVLRSISGKQNERLAVPIQELRRLPVTDDPHEDLYQQVFTAHDLHHADRHSADRDPGTTWTDVRSLLDATAANAISAGRRTELLGMLARLPPPAAPGILEDIVTELHGDTIGDQLPAPRAWRDGLGMLYDVQPEEMLRYAVHAATAARPHADENAAEQALWDWARTEAADMSRPVRSLLASDYESRRRARGNASARRTSDGPPRREVVLLEIAYTGYGRNYGWRIAIVTGDGDVMTVHADEQGTESGYLPRVVAPALAETLDRCDRPGYAAPLELVLPSDLLPDLPVETWRLGDRMLGADRPIVTRLGGARTTEDLTVNERRRERWHTLHDRPPVPVVLDGGVRTELPALPPDALPVLSGGDATSEVLHDLIDLGHPIVLWRREPVAVGASDADFRQGIDRLVREARSPEDLPARLAALRSRLAAGDADAYWSDGLALLYDDPTRPLPGPGDLLEAP